VKEENVLGPAISGHWYYVSKGRALRQLLGDGQIDRVLDVGAGSGIFTRQLLDAGYADTGICVDPGYETERIEDHNGRKIEFIRSATGVNANLILMMDVLEHVADDLALLRQYTDVLSSSSRVLITVPAFQFLWSGHDVFLEHHRRYTMAQVEGLVRQAGLRPIRSRYFFATLFPALAAVRIFNHIRLRAGALEPRSDLKFSSPLTNKLLVGIHDLERHSFFHINRLMGLSIFCLAIRD
jgi:SAM-dependent methyltransferase